MGLQGTRVYAGPQPLWCARLVLGLGIKGSWPHAYFIGRYVLYGAWRRHIREGYVLVGFVTFDLYYRVLHFNLQSSSSTAQHDEITSLHAPPLGSPRPCRAYRQVQDLHSMPTSQMCCQRPSCTSNSRLRFLKIIRLTNFPKALCQCLNSRELACKKVCPWYQPDLKVHPIPPFQV